MQLKQTRKYPGGPDYLLSGSPKATRGSPEIQNWQLDSRQGLLSERLIFAPSQESFNKKSWETP